MDNLVTGKIEFNTYNDFLGTIKEFAQKEQEKEVKTFDLFEILHLIKTKNISEDDLYITDSNDNIWQWDKKTCCFCDGREDPMTITGRYNLIELFDLTFTIKAQSKQIKPSNALKTVIKYLENQYMDLEMSIDSCQGCMDGLDDAFEELAIYKSILGSLGVDLNNEETMQRMTDEWFAKMKHLEEAEKAKMNNLFEHTPSSIDLLISKNPKDKLLGDAIVKINNILDYLKEKQ